MPLDIYAYHNSNNDFLFVTPFISRMHISRIEYIKKERNYEKLTSVFLSRRIKLHNLFPFFNSSMCNIKKWGFFFKEELLLNPDFVNQFPLSVSFNSLVLKFHHFSKSTNWDCFNFMLQENKKQISLFEFVDLILWKKKW